MLPPFLFYNTVFRGKIHSTFVCFRIVVLTICHLAVASHSGGASARFSRRTITDPRWRRRRAGSAPGGPSNHLQAHPHSVPYGMPRRDRGADRRLCADARLRRLRRRSDDPGTPAVARLGSQRRVGPSGSAKQYHRCIGCPRRSHHAYLRRRASPSRGGPRAYRGDGCSAPRR